jgi:ubiquitin carboxyl-terminal hydrolase L5
LPYSFFVFSQFENSLRRHNHLGLVHALTLALAKSGGLPAAKEKAKEAMKERRERAEAEKKMQH